MKLMVTFLRPKAPASHVASPIALAATPHEGHSRSSLVGSWVGLLADAVDRRWRDGRRVVKSEKSRLEPTCN